MYRIFISQNDKQKALKIIMDGLYEYLSLSPADYLKEYETSIDSNKIDTPDLYADENTIVILTEIANEDELLELSIDGRKKDKITIYVGVEYFNTDDLLADLGNGWVFYCFDEIKRVHF